MQHKRERLARLSGRLGMLNLLERLAAARPGLVVFTYHRIAGPGDDPYYDPVISATPSGFAEQVEAIARRMRVLTLEEAIGRIEAGGPWRGTSALLTFDDGYRDNFEVAAPILAGRGIPATFFLPTAFLESPTLPWWDAVAFLLKRARPGPLELPVGRDGESDRPPLAIGLAAGPRSEAIRTVVAAFLDGSIRDGDWFLAMMAERAGVVLDREAMGRALFADWDLVRRTTGAGIGMSVGAHGHSHRKLADLDVDQQRRELSDSRRILQERLGREVEAMAYPYGWPGTVTDRTKALAAEAGYRAAFVAVEGINRPGAVDPMAVRRLNVGGGDSAVLLRARAALHGTIGRSFL